MSSKILPGIGVLLAAFVPIAGHAQRSRAADGVTFAVSPSGDDHADGSATHPFLTLKRAQAAVRMSNGAHDVVVQLADGVYRLSEPLLFRTPDGGQGKHSVSWVAAPDAHPVLSGGVEVQGWKLWNEARGIYVADVPKGVDSRQLWVNGHLAPLAQVEVDRKSVTFSRQGIAFNAAPAYLHDLTFASRLEVRATGFFTERVSPVEHVAGSKLVMRQPAWDNNLWGYDTIGRPYHPESSHLYLVNALPLLTEAGQWFLDPALGKLYLRPPAGADPAHMDVELPRITVLVSIGGTLEAPVHDLTFKGLRFSHTTWMGPSSAQGYASQQSGSFLAVVSPAFPADPIGECGMGCPAFESVRNEWNQMPASVQVSAAHHITFRGNVFAHLGQYALGIGNDDDATLSGIGLGTGDVEVTANVFTDLAGGAVLAGGVRRDAHHPHNPRQLNSGLIVRSNRIFSVGEDYADNSAILSTYVTGAAILHNDISRVPYDAIDIGYGWGMQDAGGNLNYRFRMHGYDWPQNLIYDKPTPHRDVIVANNRIHDAKRLFHDGGAIYNLSASPGTLITENYIFDNHAQIALYLDEGSRYVMVRRNVVQDPGSEWLNVNTVHAAYPLRISPDNTADNNWHDGTKIGGLWTNYQNDLILNDHLIAGDAWPAEAQQVMKDAGIEATYGLLSYGDAQPDAAEKAKSTK